MTTDRFEISVVLCSAGPGHHLAAQLDGLAAQVTAFAWELIVVDNGMTPESLATVQGFQGRLPALRVLEARHPRGPAHGRNAGAHAARSDKVAFCDDDDVVCPGWVEAMHRALDQAELVGGRLDIETLNPPDVRTWRSQGQTDGLYAFPGHLPFVMSCNMGVRRAAFLAAGGFNPSLYPGEDVELSWKLQELGHRAGFAADAVVQYRYRSTLRAHLRQQRTYGRSSALVKGSRQSPGQTRVMARALGDLVLHTPLLLRSRDDRARHLGALAFWYAEATTLAFSGRRARQRA